MGRKRRYSPKEFKQAVEKYFRSITFIRTIRDEYNKPLLDVDGNEIKLLEYASPPSLGELRRAIGISADTWSEYAKLDGYRETCADARERVECWLERELVSRQKGVEGIKFNLANNYGWNSESRREIKLQKDAVSETRPLSIEEKLAIIADAADSMCGVRTASGADNDEK
ncbi:MAG: hypothetical protein HFE63_01415 [Clostridiales bacterium]|nr:hypothetical protein [Clostridiales bacterium]